MNKHLIFPVLLAGVLVSSAQTSKLQSAISDLRNERLGKAKINVEAACTHEKTMTDPKTWYYAGSIYCNLVEMSSKDPEKFEKQKITESVAELITLAKTSILKSIELEKATNTQEFIGNNMQNLNYLGTTLYNAVIPFVQKGDWEKSIAYLTAVADITNITGKKELLQQSQFLLAQCYVQSKDNDKAKDLYRELVKANTKEATAYINLYTMYIAEKDTTKAVNVMKKAVRNLPNDFKILTVYAAAQLQEGDLNGAFESLNKATQIDPKNFQIRNAAGNVLRDARKYEESIAEYNKSLELQPQQYDANYGLGSVYYNHAIDLADEANKLPVEESAKYEELNGKANVMFEKAIPYFEEALKQKDKDYYSLIGLRNIYSKLGKTDKYKEIQVLIEQTNHK